MAGCLGDETIAAYVDGALELEAVLRVDHHIDECAACRTHISAVAAAPIVHSFITNLEGSRPVVAIEGLVTGQPGDPVPELAIGRYIAEAVIGRGGMGIVLRARDPELERAIAIKLVSTRGGHGSEGEWRARLRDEARAMARLRHPNVITVHDVGTIGNQLFVAMELVEGVGLARWLADRREDALASCVAVGRGLCAAHAAGIVHGDIKPDNIIVDRDGRALIGDFGVARAAGAPDADGRTLVGTPLYMAPEQLRRRPADAKSDQFALAVTVYEAYTGRRPWRGDSIDGLLHAIEHDALVRPREIPRAVWRVITRALAFEPGERYPSLVAFVDALERAGHTKRLWLAGSAVAVAGIAATVVLLARPASASCADPIDRAPPVVMSTLCGQAPSPQCRTLATKLDEHAATWRKVHIGVCEATREGRQSEALLDRRMRCLDDRLREHDALVGRQATSPSNADVFDALTALQRLEPAASCATFDRATTPRTNPGVAIAEQWIAQAKVDFGLGHFASGERAFAPRIDAIRALGEPELVFVAMGALGDLQERLGDLAGAERSFDAGLRAAGEANDDNATADFLLALAHVQGVGREQWQRAAELVRMAEVAVARAGNPPVLEARLLGERGFLASANGDLAAARSHFSSAVELLRRTSTPINVALSLQHLCNAEGSAGELANALAHCEEAFAIVRDAMGAAHPFTAEAEVNVGVALASGGDIAAARKRWESALATLERALEPDAPALGKVLVNLVTAARALDDEPAAQRYLDHAVAVAKRADQSFEGMEVQDLVANGLRVAGKLDDSLRILEPLAHQAAATLGATHPTTVRILGDLGTVHYIAGRFREAREVFDQAYASASRLFGERGPVTIQFELRSAEASFMLEDDAIACPKFEHAMLALEVIAPNEPKLAEAYTNYALCSLELGKADRAVDAARKALEIRERRGDNPLQTAQARFALGQALWRTRRDPSAVALVTQARDEMRPFGARAPALEQAERWIAGQR